MQKPLPLNQQQLSRSWDVSQRSTAADWNEWLRRLNVDLLKESPSPALRSCSALAQAYTPLARDLFHAAFVSCWHELSEQYQDSLVSTLPSPSRTVQCNAMHDLCLRLRQQNTASCSCRVVLCLSYAFIPPLYTPETLNNSSILMSVQLLLGTCSSDCFPLEHNSAGDPADPVKFSRIHGTRCGSAANQSEYSSRAGSER